jgi:predicted TIM-barrel fold metal-dependent hydrolase
MRAHRWHRRTVLKSIPILAAGVAGGASLPRTGHAASAPWSAGTESARNSAPPNATDCHQHIYDSRFPVDPHAVLRPADATVADYRLLQKRIGTTRNVVVQPSTYGVDNSCMLDALSQFGKQSRGVAVVNTGVSDSELQRLNDAGVRGIRFNLAPPGATTVDMIAPLAARVKDLGWHIQINMAADQILGIQDVLTKVSTEIVFDHLGHIPEPAGTAHPAFAFISGLVKDGKACVKLSGAYFDSKVGPPTYADSGAIVKAYIKEAPERLVWGSDWPHPTEKTKPDDALLFDLFAEWAGDEAMRRRILVDNPARLYGFS